ncbi:MAG: hypothetical protein RLZZ326_2310, partial [Planctomycetota bacterium]
DVAFQNAIAAVSAEGRVRWGVEHLFYVLDRRYPKPLEHQKFFALPFLWLLTLGVAVAVVWLLTLGVAVAVVDPALALVLAVGAVVLERLSWFPFMLLLGVVWAVVADIDIPALALALALAVRIVIHLLSAWFARRPTLRRSRFERLYSRWEAEHGPPPGVIKRRPAAESTPEVEADIGDYSFDRAVICDRARTVDLLLANNFHFENNCAILSVDGYPQGPFETVRSMLKRNRRLAVYALHDATPAGCRLARTLAQDLLWFAGSTTVIDVGLRPMQAAAIKGPFMNGNAKDVGTEPGLSAWEATWLAKHRLELAVISPEQIVKRLFRAINQPPTERPNADNVIFLSRLEPLPQESRDSRDTTVLVEIRVDAGGDAGGGGLAEEAGDADGAFDAFG